MCCFVTSTRLVGLCLPLVRCGRPCALPLDKMIISTAGIRTYDEGVGCVSKTSPLNPQRALSNLDVSSSGLAGHYWVSSCTPAMYGPKTIPPGEPVEWKAFALNCSLGLAVLSRQHSSRWYSTHGRALRYRHWVLGSGAHFWAGCCERLLCGILPVLAF